MLPHTGLPPQRFPLNPHPHITWRAPGRAATSLAAYSATQGNATQCLKEQIWSQSAWALTLPLTTA
jgi:hypothetical protein